MLHTEFTASLRRLQLSQAEFARLVGVETGTVWRWTNGDRAVPSPVVAIIKLLMIHQRQTIRQLVSSGLPEIAFTPEEILGISADATNEMKKKQWRSLAKKVHPRKLSDTKKKTEDMQRVNAAYERICGG